MPPPVHDAPDRVLADPEHGRHLGLGVALAQLPHLGVALQGDLARWRRWGWSGGGQALVPVGVFQEVGAPGRPQHAADRLMGDAEVMGDGTDALALGPGDDGWPLLGGEGGRAGGYIAWGWSRLRRMNPLRCPRVGRGVEQLDADAGSRSIMRKRIPSLPSLLLLRSSACLPAPWHQMGFFCCYSLTALMTPACTGWH